jgi:hypothetical protein
VEIGFLSEENARAFLRLNPFILEHVYDLDRQVTRPLVDPKVEAIEVIQGDIADTTRAVLAERKRIQDANAKATKEHVEALDAAERATAEVWADWRRLRAREYEHGKVRATLAEYVKLTDGDEELAKRFLAKAYSASLIDSAFAVHDKTGRPARTATTTPARHTTNGSADIPF